MTWLIKLWGWLSPRIAYWLGIIGLVLAVIVSIRHAGKQAERIKALETSLKNIRKRDEVEREIDSLSDDDIRKRLRKWTTR